MLAARFYGQKDIRVEEVPTPELSAPDDLLVEVHWCGICGTDLHEYSVGPIVTAVKPHPLTGASLPQTLGHDSRPLWSRPERRSEMPASETGSPSCRSSSAAAAATAGVGRATSA